MPRWCRYAKPSGAHRRAAGLLPLLAQGVRLSENFGFIYLGERRLGTPFDFLIAELGELCASLLNKRIDVRWRALAFAMVVAPTGTEETLQIFFDHRSAASQQNVAVHAGKLSHGNNGQEPSRNCVRVDDPLIDPRIAAGYAAARPVREVLVVLVGGLLAVAGLRRDGAARP